MKSSSASPGAPRSNRGRFLPRIPISLWLVVVLVGLQGLGASAYAVGELGYGILHRAGTAFGVALFLGAYGVALLAGAWFLLRRRSVARAPVALAQLLHLGIAWNMRAAPLTAYAIALAAVSLITLVALLWPSTTAALADADADTGADGGDVEDPPEPQSA